MANMNLEQLSQELMKNGRYETAPEAVKPFLRRHPLLATIKFHWLNAGVVVKNSRLARRAQFGAAEWRIASMSIYRFIEACGGTVKLEGFANVRNLNEPAVFVGNHMSLLETFMVPGIVLHSGDVSFVVKQSLIDYPVFGHIMRATVPIAVSRTNPREDLKAVLTQGTKLLTEGRSVVIFPQATRASTFSEENFNTLGAKLATRAKVPVIPVAVKTDFLTPGRWLKDFGMVNPSRQVCFAYGQPLRSDDTRQLHQRTIHFIRSKLSEWQ